MDVGRGRLASENRISRRRALALVSTFSALAVLLASCSEIKIHHRRVLDRIPISETFSTSPVPEAARAELQVALSLDGSNPELAIASYREAALKAFPSLLTQEIPTKADPDSWSGPEAIYRRAIEYMILAAQRVALRDGVHWTDVLASQGIVTQGKVSAYPAQEWDEVMPSRSFEIKGFHRIVGRGGMGAPLVFSRTRAEKPTPEEAYFPPRHFKAATAILRPGSATDQGPTVFELFDPAQDTEMTWVPSPGTKPLPLAYDLTTPLAQQFHDNKLSTAAILGVLNPGKLDRQTGIYMLDPYDPEKIPVIFVHGLLSSPEAWTNAVNEIRGDPKLRKKYQFWMFFYSTGNPILASASRLKKAVLEARELFDPTHTNAKFDRLVMIGHSMGGLLTQINVSSSGMTLWNNATKVTPEELDINPHVKQTLMDALIFEPNPVISRVIFVATPHQGSPLGYQFIGRVTSSLIRLPKTVTDFSKALTEINVLGSDAPALRDRQQLTGVAQLSSRNKTLQTLSQLPIEPTVPYHSIIGFNGEDNLQDGGDGVVPYKSAHMEGAMTELVVASGHSAQENTQAIIEMRRILYLHLKEDPVIARPAGPTPIRYALEPAGPDDINGLVE